MKKAKEKGASGLDGIKPDLLKIIGEDEYCLRVMVNGMNKILNKEEKKQQSEILDQYSINECYLQDVHGNT